MRHVSQVINAPVPGECQTGPSDFLGLASVMPVGLADVNIKHLAQNFLLFKGVAQQIEPDAGAKNTAPSRNGRQGWIP